MSLFICMRACRRVACTPNMSLFFDDAIADMPLLSLGDASYVLLPPGSTAAPPLIPVSDSPPSLPGLRTAYVHGAHRGVIEVLTLTKRIFYPLKATTDVFHAPSKTAAVVLRDGAMQTALLYESTPKGRGWWRALRDADARSGSAHFLAPVHHEPNDVTPMVRSIYEDESLSPTTPVTRNGSVYFFNATLLVLLRDKQITLDAADSLYVDLASRAAAPVFGGVPTDVQFTALAFVLWAAMASTGRLPSLPPRVHVGVEQLLLLYHAAATTLRSAPLLPYVPPTLYVVLHKASTSFMSTRPGEFHTTLMAAETLLLSASQRKITIRFFQTPVLVLPPLTPSQPLSTDFEREVVSHYRAASIPPTEVVIQQDALQPNALVPLVGKRVGDRADLADYIQRFMGVSPDDDDFGVGIVEDRFVLYTRPTPTAAPRLKTLSI